MLAKSWRVIAPVQKDGASASEEFVFSEIAGSDISVALSYPATILPPKEFLLPPHETLFEYEGDAAKASDASKILIFGLSLEDLEGVFRLDQIFDRPVADETYKKRRANTILVAIDRFSPPKHIPFDLYLMKVSEKQFVGYAGSHEGQKILKSSLFKNQTVRIPAVKKTPDPLLSDKDLSRAIEKSKKHKVWDELAETCFGCGICSYVCPLCYCFETHDEINFGGSENLCGKRCRTWDSCMLKHFAETTHHNFRPELRGRIYNWYFHKFVRMPREYGFSGCVDCSRCVVYCPAKINYRKILEEILADYKKLHRRKK